jgi:hypothetical protein
MIKLKIDLTKLTGAKLMTSKSGKPILVIDLDKSRTFQGKNGAVYADLCVIERREVGEYGDTHFIAEDVSKEEREDGVKGAIVGNGKELEKRQQSRGREDHPQRREPVKRDTVDDVFTAEEDIDSIPF